MKKTLSNGRLDAYNIIKKFGTGSFRKKTAIEALRNAGVENPEGKWDYLVRSRHIKKVRGKKDQYTIQ